MPIISIPENKGYRIFPPLELKDNEMLLAMDTPERHRDISAFLSMGGRVSEKKNFLKKHIYETYTENEESDYTFKTKRLYHLTIPGNPVRLQSENLSLFGDREIHLILPINSSIDSSGGVYPYKVSNNLGSYCLDLEWDEIHTGESYREIVGKLRDTGKESCKYVANFLDGISLTRELNERLQRSVKN